MTALEADGTLVAIMLGLSPARRFLLAICAAIFAALIVLAATGIKPRGELAAFAGLTSGLGAIVYWMLGQPRA